MKPLDFQESHIMTKERTKQCVIYLLISNHHWLTLALYTEVYLNIQCLFFNVWYLFDTEMEISSIKKKGLKVKAMFFPLRSQTLCSFNFKLDYFKI